MRTVYLDTEHYKNVSSALLPESPALLLWDCVLRFLDANPSDIVLATGPNPLGLPVASGLPDGEEVVALVPSGCDVPVSWQVCVPDASLTSWELEWSPAKAALFGAQLGECQRLVSSGLDREKAAKLIRKYGTCEAILENIALVTPKKIWPLIVAAVQTPATGVPAAPDYEAWEPAGIQDSSLEILSPLLWKAYVSCRMASRTGYTRLRTRSDIQTLREEMLAAEYVAIDTETSGVDHRTLYPVGMSIATDVGRSWYVPFLHFDYQLPADIRMEFLDMLQDVLVRHRVPVVMHQAKFDLRVLRKMGIQPREVNLKGDNRLMAYAACLGAGNKELGLKKLTFKILGIKMTDIQDLIGKKGKKQIPFWQVSANRATPYAAQDSDYTYRLHPVIREKLKEVGGQELYEELEHRYLHVIIEMEDAGMALDTELINELRDTILDPQIAEAKQAIFELVGEEFNTNSQPQLQHILFDKLKIRRTKKTKTGYATDVKTLTPLRGSHEIIKLLIGDGYEDGFLGLRGLEKLRSTYVENMVPHPVTGRLHCTLHQDAVVSGRLSSSDPNLQNIPVRTKLGAELRKAFIAQHGFDYVDYDFSQLELRIMAHLIVTILGRPDDPLVQAFIRDEDPHRAAAARMYGKHISMVTDDERRSAKIFNFGIAYGLTVPGLAERFGVSRDAAQKLLDQYFEAFPGVRDLMQWGLAFAREYGYTETPFFHRRRYCPDIYAKDSKVREAAEREAFNHIVQGGGVEIVKLSQVILLDAIRHYELSCRMLLQIHDEVILECPRHETPIVVDLINSIVPNTMKLAVPLIAEPKVGHSWADVH